MTVTPQQTVREYLGKVKGPKVPRVPKEARNYMGKIGRRGGKIGGKAKTEKKKKQVKQWHNAGQKAIEKKLGRKFYPKCTKYKSHRFSKSGVCYGCDFKRPE